MTDELAVSFQHAYKKSRLSAHEFVAYLEETRDVDVTVTSMGYSFHVPLKGMFVQFYFYEDRNQWFCKA